jgi:uncharacterized membrane protein/ribosomal protein L40E
MASLSNAKSLGGTGGILIVVSGLFFAAGIIAPLVVISALFGAISIIGWILILLALKEISIEAKEKSILKDGIIGGIAAMVTVLTIVVLLADGAARGFVASVIGLSADLGPGGFLGAFGTFAVFYAFAIVSGIFLKRAYDMATQKLSANFLATTGLLYLVSAITSILVVGFLIFFISFIYQIVAYFSIQDRPQFYTYYGYPPPPPMPTPQVPQSQTAQSQSSPTPQQQVAPAPEQTAPQPTPQTTIATPPQATPLQTSTSQFKFCFMCGTKLPAHAVYCSNCGSRQ